MSESKVELERVYTIPLSRAWIAPRHRRTRRAVNILREFAEKHMKSEEIKIETELNEKLWSRGITHPPRKITVKMSKDEDGVVTISLPNETKPVQERVETPKLAEEEKKPEEEKKEEPAKSEAPSPTKKSEEKPVERKPRKKTAKSKKE